jgi:hypothetical protein
VPSIYTVPNRRLFTLTVGGPNLQETLDWIAALAIVDNNSTTQYLYLPDADRFIPPLTFGAQIPLPNIGVARALYQGPPLVPMGAAIPGQQSKILFLAGSGGAGIPPNPGGVHSIPGATIGGQTGSESATHTHGTGAANTTTESAFHTHSTGAANTTVESATHAHTPQSTGQATTTGGPGHEHTYNNPLSLTLNNESATHLHASAATTSGNESATHLHASAATTSATESATHTHTQN